MFVAVERIELGRDGNYVHYSCGPVQISVCTYNTTIVLRTTPGNGKILREVYEVAYPAWNIQPDTFVIMGEFEIIIEYNTNIISNYLRYMIVYNSFIRKLQTPFTDYQQPIDLY